MITVHSATDPKAAYEARATVRNNRKPSPLEVARSLVWQELNKLPENPSKEPEISYRFNLEQIAVRLEHGFGAEQVIESIDGTTDDYLALAIGRSAIPSIREAVLILKADGYVPSNPATVQPPLIVKSKTTA